MVTKEDVQKAQEVLDDQSAFISEEALEILRQFIAKVAKAVGVKK